MRESFGGPHRLYGPAAARERPTRSTPIARTRPPWRPALGHEGRSIALTASLGPDELDALRAAHERSDWVMTLDRYLGIDYTRGSRTAGH